MDNKSSYVLYVSDRPGSTFVCTNNVVFGTKCPRAKDSPNVIDDGEVTLNFPQEANHSEISSSSIEATVDQTVTHYILQMMMSQSSRWPRHILFRRSFERKIIVGRSKVLKS